MEDQQGLKVGGASSPPSLKLHSPANALKLANKIEDAITERLDSPLEVRRILYKGRNAAKIIK